MRYLSQRVVRSSLCSAAIALFAIALTARPARAALQTDGAPRAAVWQRIYDHMPAFWKSEEPVLIREVTDDQMDRLVADVEGGASRAKDQDSVVDGYYQNGAPDTPATITLRRSLSGTSAELVFAHEYGHFGWDDRLSDAQRQEYRRIWARAKKAHRLVTDYASDSPEEGFAEAYSYFVLRPLVLHKRDPLSYNFLCGVTHPKP